MESRLESHIYIYRQLSHLYSFKYYIYYIYTKWKITSATASKSGNKATGDVTAKRYVLGIPVETVEKTITLTCSASGVIS